MPSESERDAELTNDEVVRAIASNCRDLGVNPVEAQALIDRIMARRDDSSIEHRALLSEGSALSSHHPNRDALISMWVETPRQPGISNSETPLASDGGHWRWILVRRQSRLRSP